MPIYEFRCEDCAAKVALLVGMTADSTDERCPKCQGSRLRRLVSRFYRGRDEDARIDEIADRLEEMGEPDSPSAMRDMVREVGKAMDEDLSDELEEMYEMDAEEGDSDEID